MPDINPVPLDKAWRLLNHGPVTIITSAHGERRNLMAASWVMPLEFDPFKLLVVFDRTTFTSELIAESGVFAVSIPRRSQAQLVFDVGHETGRQRDKFAAFGAEVWPATAIAPPLVQGCVAWLECRLTAFEKQYTGGSLAIAEVLAAHADASVFSEGRWPMERGANTLHYVAGGVFLPTGAPITVRSESASPFV